MLDTNTSQGARDAVNGKTISHANKIKSLQNCANA